MMKMKMISIIKKKFSAPSQPCSLSVFVVPEDSDRPIAESYRVDTSEASSLSITVDRTRAKNKPYPYSNCTETQRLEHFDRYDPLLCKLELNVKDILDACGCLPFGYFMHRDAIAGRGLKTCGVEKLHHCASNGSLSLAHGSSECPPACENTYFSLLVNRRPGRLSLDQLFADSPTMRAMFTDPSVSWTRIRVAYGRLVFSQLIESPVSTVPDMMSKVGGALSLWLGVRCMSFLQLGYFVLWWGRRALGGKVAPEPPRPPPPPPQPTRAPPQPGRGFLQFND